MKEARKHAELLGLRGLLALGRARVTGTTVLHRVTPPGVAHPLWLRIPSSDVPTYRHIFDKRVYEFTGQIGRAHV